MAIKREIQITADTSQAVREVDRLDDSLKDVSKQSDKTSSSLKDVGDNGGAIALLDSVTGGLATRMRDAFEATKLFNFSLKGTKTALIATGIGLFVVALGAVVAYWDEIDDFMKGTTKRLERQILLYEQVSQELDHQLKINQQQQKLAELQGESTENLLKLEREILVEKRENLEKTLLAYEAQLAIEESKKREVTLLEKGLIGLKAYVFGYQSVGESVVGALGFDKLSELQGKLNEIREQIGDVDIAIATIDNPEGKENDPLEKVSGVDGFDETKKNAEIEAEKEAAFQADLKRLEDGYLERVRISDAEIALEKEKNAQIQADEERLKQAKIAIAGQTLNILGSLAKEGSALAKGIAASQAVINTFQGVTAALSATSVIPDPFGAILKFANAAAIGISGAINVKNILKTKPVTTSAPTTGGGGAPPAPSFNLVQGSASNQIADSIQGQDKPIKAFVTSKDVTSGQEMDRNIEGNASL